jgi:simple sugar transport system ATP-binding protein
MPSSNSVLIEAADLAKQFGSVVALGGVSLAVRAGEVVCLIGDNGAGKSTLIKMLSGVFKPTSGRLLVKGQTVSFNSPRDAQAFGIATVYQELSVIPLMSITRNFFLGREPCIRIGPFRIMDMRRAEKIVLEEMDRIGIHVRDPQQAVGTLSGGERQCIAIARAVYFGAKVLILDEPTSALGVHQTAMVLKYIERVKANGLGVIFITHNVWHAYTVGDTFSVLNRGGTIGTYRKEDVSINDLQRAMAGGRDVSAVAQEIGSNV